MRDAHDVMRLADKGTHGENDDAKLGTSIDRLAAVETLMIMGGEG